MGRGRNKLDNKNPGPGAYDPDIKPVTPRSPSIAIGGRHGTGAGTPVEDGCPGPGAYTTEPPHARFGPSFTIQGKHGSDKALDDLLLTPGPGSYKPCPQAVQIRDPAYSMQGRRLSFPREVSPGPGSYTAHAEPYGPAFSISAKRALATAVDLPGPGAYSATLDACRPRSPSVTIGSRPGRRLEEDKPGPGQYVVNGGVAAVPGPAYSMGRKPVPAGMEESPGPGAYSAAAAIRHAAPAYSMARRTAYSSPTQESSPGPGAYASSPEPRNRGAVMLGRQPEKKPEISPGPGAYFWKTTGAGSSKRPTTPAFTIAGKPAVKPLTDASAPGPGAYDPKYVSWGAPPAYSMSSRKASKPLKESPGPGEYKVAVKPAQSSPAFSMGVKLLPPKPADPVPGPGAYPAKSSLGGHDSETSAGAHNKLEEEVAQYRKEFTAEQSLKSIFMRKSKTKLPFKKLITQTPDRWGNASSLQHFVDKP